MSRVRPTWITMTLLVVAALPGCGEEADRAGAPAVTPTATATRSAVPADLAGAWQVTVKRSELPEDEPELEGDRSGNGRNQYRLEFHATGGKGDGPSMTLDHPDGETFVIPISVTDKRITVEGFVDCRAFGYAVESDRLTFEPSHDGCVRDHTLAAILATRAWRRT